MKIPLNANDKEEEEARPVINNPFGLIENKFFRKSFLTPIEALDAIQYFAGALIHEGSTGSKEKDKRYL